MKAINVKRLCVVAAPFLFAASAQADVVTDWNQKASEIAVAHQGGPWGQAPMVLIQAAVFESVNAITRRYPQAGYLKLEAPAGASIDAAVAAANRVVLTRMPGVAAMFDAAIARGEGALDSAVAARVPN